MDPTETKQLGNTSVRVSRLGLGMASLGDAGRTSDADSTAVIAGVRSLGLNHVDTAPEYGLGLAERRLGAAIAELGRGDLVISTKVGRLIRPASRGYRIRHTIVESVSSVEGARVLGRKVGRVAGRLLRPSAATTGNGASASASPVGDDARPAPPRDLASIPAAICDYSYDGIMRSFEESLARLGMDRVDVLFIHQPDLHLRQAGRSAYRALDGLRAAGSIAAIGVGINDPEALVKLADHGDYDCFLLGGRYTLLEQPAIERLLPLALARGISILLGGPFNSGILANPVLGAKYDHAVADQKRLEKARRIDAVCGRHGVSLKAAALQFPLGHPAVVSVLVGAASPAEMAEDAELMRQAIPAALWEELRHEGLMANGVPVPA